MAELSRQALLAQMTPDAFTGGKVLTAPALSKLPQSGKLDSFLNTLGTVGTIGGAAGSLMKPRPEMSALTYVGMPASLPGQQVAAPTLEELQKRLQGVQS